MTNENDNATPMPAPEPNDAPVEIKLSEFIAKALVGSMNKLMPLKAEADRTAALYQTASSIHQEFFTAIIQDAGFDLHQFSSYNVWQENGETFIKATPKRKE